MELIGNLAVKNPAFVNILPTNSGGSTAAADSVSTLSGSLVIPHHPTGSGLFLLTESNGKTRSLVD